MFNPYKIEGPAQIGFSGGRSSAYMLRKIVEAHDGKLPHDVVVTFQNTGKEKEQTLSFVKRCGEEFGVEVVWLEFDGEYPAGLSWKRVDFESASRNGEPFDKMLRYYDQYRSIEKKEPPILPNVVNRMCSDRMKIKAATHWMRDVVGIDSWSAIIGIRYDEPKRYHRMMLANEKGSNRWENILPMYEDKIVKADVDAFWSGNHFDLGIDSDFGNCDLCFLKHPDKIIRMLRKEPHLADWWIAHEQRTGQVFNLAKPTYKQLKWIAENQEKQIEFDFSDSVEVIDCMCGD